MNKNKKILIIGSDGMLGMEMVKVFGKDNNYEVTGWDIENIDITNNKDTESKILKLKPAFIVNCAAYNAVDDAEEKIEYEKAKKLNGTAPGNLAKISKKIGATLVHFSSDYVFSGMPEIQEPAGCTHTCSTCSLHQGGMNDLGFREEDKPKPISNYGRTKLLGEREILKNTKKFYLIRLSRLFGKPAAAKGAKKSFFDTMLEAGKKNKEVKVIHDEISCFTYAPDLARKAKEIIEAKKPFGIYHIVNSEPCSWYEAVLELYRLAKIKAKVQPVFSEDFPRPAERPFFSVLANTKLNPLRSYKEALKEYLKTIKKK
jgi:dTDP-4-dehydrorhamnose reductase